MIIIPPNAGGAVTVNTTGVRISILRWIIENVCHEVP